ncbi:MAG: hypothetical protein ABFC96_17770 [Thermoguttaceae bacterium]
MCRPLQGCRGFVQACVWCLAASLAVGLAGCKEWWPRDEGLRDNGLAKSARQARGEKSEKKDDKNVEFWGWSSKSRQVERDLAGE